MQCIAFARIGSTPYHFSMQSMSSIHNGEIRIFAKAASHNGLWVLPEKVPPHICVNICPSKVSSLWDKRISSKRVQIRQAIRADRRSSKSSSYRRMNNARSFPFGRPSRGRLDPDAFVRRKVSSRNAVHYWNWVVAR